MGILRGVSGKVLDCGCLAGIYETYSGDLVTVIDSVGPSCSKHHKGDSVPEPPPASARARPER